MGGAFDYAMLHSMNMLVIKDLTKIYGSGAKAKLALDAVSLTIPKGSFFGLLGPNGAGKSTLIHCITGIAMPTQGHIQVGGLDVVTAYKAARVKVGLSPQEFNVDIFSTPKELMDFMGGYYGIPAKIRNRRVAELLKRFDLEEHQNIKFQKLSGGLKRRTMLGRALVHVPELLILDEPTAGVDVEQRRALWEYLKELNEQGVTIILTSHYLEEVEYLCDEVAVIANGKIIASGSKADYVREQGSLEIAYLKIIDALK